MQITAQLVKELRQRSGAGMMECKKALTETEGDLDAGMEWLRKQGLAKAGKKADRVAAEGRVVGARETGKAVLVEINCETDFVAKDDNFQAFSDKVADIALQADVSDADGLNAAEYPDEGTVADAAKALIGTIGEKIEVRRLARVAGDGAIGSYIHGGRIGVLVALDGGSEELAKGLAMHVAAMNPQYISRDDVPADMLQKEKDMAKSQLGEKEQAKPDEIQEKIVAGKVDKVINEMTLTGQAYVMDTASTVGQVLEKEGASIHQLERLALGEGIEKQEEDFAAEVKKQAGMS